MKHQNKKVYLLGKEGTGWSIDKDRYYTQKVIEDINEYEITNNIFKADIIYAIWWNKLLSKSFKFFNFFFKKNIIAALTNDLTHQKELINSLLPITDVFVYANSKQKEFLLGLGVKSDNLVFNPFYVDEKIFKKLVLNKKEICKQLNIEYKQFKNKFLIGSFQRDSLGSNLSKSKWQKDPDMIIDIMDKLDRDKFSLVLAGPRRHYIIEKCKQKGINYILVGDEEFITEERDDILVNGLPIEVMPLLYNLIDIYIVSSKSEGGPKAIPESLLCETKVISTDVGFANDIIHSDDIYHTSEEAVNKICNFYEKKINQDSKVHEFYNFELFKKRIKNILNKV